MSVQHEYEHQFGQSHAFSREQVAARVKQIRAAGFNAFRDAHQPHHLDYQKYWDRSALSVQYCFSEAWTAVVGKAVAIVAKARKPVANRFNIFFIALNSPFVWI